MTKSNNQKAKSFIYISDLSQDDLRQLLNRATEIKTEFREKGKFPRTLKRRQVALLFVEPSTRTRISFQMAVQRMGGDCLLFDNPMSSSMVKGESLGDTFWTFHANRPDAIVIRCSDQENLENLATPSEIPIINAGYGKKAHPTQALLDVMTLLEARMSMQNQKVLFVGDVLHSRVVASHFRLLKMLGAEIALCGPAEFMPGESEDYKVFTELDEAIGWATVYYGLRVQLERHGDEKSKATTDQFVQNYSLNKERLARLPETTLILHPGPVNWGVEFQKEVAQDSRLLMWQQKENGAYVRGALLEMLIERRYQ